ncbi:MAG: ECF transporter S component [Clostridia bacterium]|nr:ECF transporter S component [Clostridia bacterium]
MSHNSLRSSRMTFYVTRIAMLVAVATPLMMFDFPMPIFPGFYKFDLSYFPVVISTFSMGPVAGFITAVLKNLISFLIAGTFTDSAGIGALADTLIGLSFILPAGLIYRKMHTKKGAIASLSIALAVVSVFSCAFNYWFLIPTYSKFFGLDAVLGMAQSACKYVTDVKGIIVLGTLPFNLLKCLVISILTILTYKPLSKTILKKPK